MARDQLKLVSGGRVFLDKMFFVCEVKRYHFMHDFRRNVVAFQYALEGLFGYANLLSKNLRVWKKYVHFLHKVFNSALFN